MSNVMDTSSFVSLLLDSDDDYEPYGMALCPQHAGSYGDKTGYIASQVPLHYTDDSDYWLSE